MSGYVWYIRLILRYVTRPGSADWVGFYSDTSGFVMSAKKYIILTMLVARGGLVGPYYIVFGLPYFSQSVWFSCICLPVLGEVRFIILGYVYIRIPVTVLLFSVVSFLVQHPFFRPV